jgi:hypothetical protein
MIFGGGRLTSLHWLKLRYLAKTKWSLPFQPAENRFSTERKELPRESRVS